MSIDFMIETVWRSVVISRVATGFAFTSDAYIHLLRAVVSFWIFYGCFFQCEKF